MTNENENDINIPVNSDSNINQAIVPEVVINRQKYPTRYFFNNLTAQVNRLYNIGN